MGEVTVTNGMFSWTDLSTPEPAKVKGFYEALFGWETEDMPAGEGMTYTMFRKGGKDVAGLGAQPPEQTAQGIPPSWNSYITVDDVDAVTDQVEGLGGQVIMAPMDVMDAGRMAVIQDSTGAVVCLWQPLNHRGAGLFNEHGALTWNELATRDQASATAFYERLLGWSYDQMQSPAGPYEVIMNQDRPNGGILQMNHQWPEHVPSHWMVYFAVDDVAESTKKVEELGGSVHRPPFEIGVGKMSVVADPSGGVFTLFRASDATGQ